MSQDKKRPGVGVGVMILRNNKVLLGKRHDDPEKASSLLHGEGHWTMPGGKLDFQEDLREAAAREAEEETGIKIATDDLELVSVSNDIVEDAHFVTIGFLCAKFQGEPKVMEPDEITKWEWFSLKALPKPIYFPSAKIINNYSEKKLL